MDDSISLDDRTYWRDFRVLKSMCCDTESQKNEHIHIYKLFHIKGQWIPYYTTCASPSEMTNLISVTPKHKYFGEVVQYGNFYFIISAELSINALIRIGETIMKYSGATRFDYSSCFSPTTLDRFYIYYIYKKVGDVEIQLFWTPAHIKTMLEAICAEAGESIRDLPIFKEVAPFVMKPIFDFTIYEQDQLLTLPNCINPVPPHRSFAHKESIYVCKINYTKPWKIIQAPSNLPKYMLNDTDASECTFYKVLKTNGITSHTKIWYPGIYEVVVKKCLVSGEKPICSPIVKLTPHHIKYFCSCTSKYLIMHSFNIIKEVQPSFTIDKYVEVEYTGMEYKKSLQILKQIVAVNLSINIVALKRRDKNGNFYWSCENINTFSERLCLVPNAKNKMVKLHKFIADNSYRLNTAVWIPYSWKYKLQDYDQYSEYINIYPEPMQPSQIYPDGNISPQLSVH